MNNRNSKLLNKAKIIKLVTMQSPISRQRLQELTGLSKMTISNLINEYVNEGVIRIGNSVSRGVGRKTEMLMIESDSLLTLGIYIKNTKIQVGIVNLNGAVLISEEVELTKSESESLFLHKMLTLCETVMTEQFLSRVWGICVSSMGPVDIYGGRIMLGMHFPNMPCVDVINPLKKRWGLPVYLENDVNVSALAEMYFGYGINYSDFLYIIVKEGIGAGVIINRQLFHGTNGFSGELGHVTVHQDGILCGCGNRGCLEKYAGTTAITEWYAEQKKINVKWPELAEMAYKGNSDAIDAIQRMADFLTTGIITAINLFDPQCIFLGGDIGLAMDILIPQIRSGLYRRFSPIGDVHITASKFPGSSSFIGTAALVMESNCSINE